MTHRFRGIAAGTASALVAAVAIVASAGSASAAPSAVWVGSAHASVPGTSCTHPGFNTIQAGLDAVATGGTVHVCGGRYVEQLQLTRAVTITGSNEPVIVLPSSPVNSTTACETPIEGYQPDQDAVAVCASGTVHISDVSIDAAWPAGTCYDSMYGIWAGGGVSLVLNYVSITAAGARPINGCQGGVGVQAGSDRTTPNMTAKLSMTNSSVTGYQKNGIEIAGKGTTGHVTTTSVTGAGATDQIAQNGIEVIGGAVGTISSVTVSGNECDVAEVCGPDPLNDTQSTGILLYGAAPTSSVATSTLITNDIGIYYLADPAGAAPTVYTVLRGNHLTDNRYEGICLDQGKANVNGNTYSGGNIGLSVLQYDGQTFGVNDAASNENMTAQQVAAFEISSDNAPDDPPGTVHLSNIAKHGGAVINNSTNINLIATNVH